MEARIYAQAFLRVLRNRKGKHAMRRIAPYFLALLLSPIFFQSKGFAHGEDKAGPHGGNIRMPGAFHTELVKVRNDVFKVYLLDLDSNTPATENSSVKATLKAGQKEAAINCKSEKDYFECKLPTKFGFKVLKEISIQAKRANSEGGIVSYSIPLKF